MAVRAVEDGWPDSVWADGRWPEMWSDEPERAVALRMVPNLAVESVAA